MATMLVLELGARAGGEMLNRLGERQAVDLLDELDHVAAVGAREAIPQAAGRGDVERRGLLVVERAQALERATTGVAELQVLADALLDGRALPPASDAPLADPP